MKFKKFYLPKDTINGAKRQPTEWEKMSVNHTFVKGLISKTNTENSSNSTTKNSKNY